MNQQTPWPELTIVAFDTETSGAYPIGYELCEIAAVKWQGGHVVDQFVTLIKPTRVMSKEVIAIHGITNEMVAEAPPVEKVIGNFHEFVKDSVLVAHHAPFDMGFMVYEFERASLSLPTNPVLCSSLLARALFPDSTNHKLQTLVKYFSLTAGTAHRALADADACLQVALQCFAKVGPAATYGEILARQWKKLSWDRFSIEALQEKAALGALVRALQQGKDVSMVYDGGSRRGRAREVRPLGIVRSPDGDFLSAICLEDQVKKRFYIDKIQSAETLS